MTQININGQPPSNGGKPSSGAARQSTQRTGTPADKDFARAEAQRDRAARDDSRAWKDHEQAEARYKRDMDRLYRQEVSQYQGRLQADQRIQHRYNLLQHRAKAPLTPSSWNAWQRAHSTLAFQALQHEEKYGSAPISAAQLSSLRGSVGSEHAAHFVGRTLRLGNVGQRAGYEHSWRELVRIERELKRIDKGIEKQSRFDQSPSAQANLARQRDSLYVARERIGAGMSGNHPLINKLGRAAGGAGLVMHSPLVRDTLAVSLAVPEAGYIVSQAYRGVLALGKPYRDWSSDVRRLGLAGGFSGRALENDMLRRGYMSYEPGNTLRDELRRFGLSPQQVTHYAEGYNVPISGHRGVIKYAESARLASLAPGMNLSEGQLGQLASQAQSVFAMPPEKFFPKLQQVMAIAGRESINSSQLAASFAAVMRVAGQSAGGVSVGSLGRWFAQMEQNRSPVTRSGAAESNYVSGIHNVFKQLGGNNPGSIALGFSWARNGMPTTAESLQHQLGVSGAKWNRMTGTPAGELALKNYLAAAKSGNGFLAMRYYGSILESAPVQTWSHVLRNSGLPTGGGFGPAIRANASGVDLLTELGVESSRRSSGSAVPPMTRASVLPIAMQAASKYHVPLDVALATFAKESSFTNIAGPGTSTGLGQVKQGVLDSYNAHNHTTYTRADLLKNPQLAANVSMWDMARVHRRTGRSWTSAYVNAYHGLRAGEVIDGHRITRSDVARDRHVFDKFRQAYGNQGDVIARQRRDALESAAALAGSRWGDQSYRKLLQNIPRELGGVLGEVEAGFHAVGHAAGFVSGELKKLGATISGFVTGHHHATQGSGHAYTRIPNMPAKIQK